MYLPQTQEALSTLQDADVSTCLDVTSDATFWAMGILIDLYSYTRNTIITTNTLKIFLDTTLDIPNVVANMKVMLKDKDSCDIGDGLCNYYKDCPFAGSSDAAGMDVLSFNCVCPWGQCIEMTLSITPLTLQANRTFAICDVQIV